MRSIYLLIFILNLLNCHAQLTVDGDNYMFISNQYIYVTNNIELKNANSKLFLRNEGQLLQGSGAIGNSGIGELSVYQEGTVNPYAYNFWCSPIGDRSASSVNNNFGISLISDIVDLTNSTPVTFNHNNHLNGISSTPINIEPHWIFTFENSDDLSEWNYVGGATTIAPGLGFTMKGIDGTTSQQYDFRGKPNNGTILNNVNAPVEGTSQLTLVGNPYPSALDAMDFIHDPQNLNAIDGTLYYWEQAPGADSHYLADYEGGYATYTINAAGTVESFVKATISFYSNDGSTLPGGIPSSSSKQARRYMPIGQGFMVVGIANSTVRTTNAMREYYKETDTDSEFFRNTENTGRNIESKTEDEDSAHYDLPKDYKRFRIYIDFDETYTRELLMNFHHTATEGFDHGLEAKSPEGTSSDAYWILDNVPYVIQAYKFKKKLKIPLVVKLDNQMSLKIRVDDVQNMSGMQPIYIHDIVNDTYLDLRKNDYSINLENGLYTDRFEITFTKKAKKNRAFESDPNKRDIVISHSTKLSRLIVKNPNYSNVTNISLLDISAASKLNEDQDEIKSKYIFSTTNLVSGIYLAKITINDNDVISKKIIIKNSN